MSSADEATAAGSRNFNQKPRQQYMKSRLFGRVWVFIAVVLRQTEITCYSRLNLTDPHEGSKHDGIFCNIIGKWDGAMERSVAYLFNGWSLTHYKNKGLIRRGVRVLHRNTLYSASTMVFQLSGHLNCAIKGVKPD